MKKRRKKSVPCVTSVPVACPKCGCSDRSHKEAIRRRPMEGRTRDGFVYTEVAWSYVVCTECSMRYRIIEYLRPTGRSRDTLSESKSTD